jgi:hypothetical protein
LKHPNVLIDWFKGKFYKKQPILLYIIYPYFMEKHMVSFRFSLGPVQGYPSWSRFSGQIPSTALETGGKARTETLGTWEHSTYVWSDHPTYMYIYNIYIPSAKLT